MAEKWTKVDVRILKDFQRLAHGDCVSVSDWVSGRGRNTKRRPTPRWVCEFTRKSAEECQQVRKVYKWGMYIDEFFDAPASLAYNARIYFANNPRRKRVLVLNREMIHDEKIASLEYIGKNLEKLRKGISCVFCEPQDTFGFIPDGSFALHVDFDCESDNEDIDGYWVILTDFGEFKVCTDNNGIDRMDLFDNVSEVLVCVLDWYSDAYYWCHHDE